MVGHSGPSSLVAALVSHDPRIRCGDRDWTSSRFCHLRENTRAIAPPFVSQCAPMNAVVVGIPYIVLETALQGQAAMPAFS